MKVLKISIIIFLFAQLLFSQSGGEGGAFLKNGFGARPNAMGNTFTGIANDISSLFYNSAGLSRLTKSEGMIMYSKLFNDVDGLTYGNVAFAQPFDFGTISIGAAYMKVADIPYVTSTSGPDGTTFSDNEVLIMTSYSRKFSDYFHIGGTLKIVNHSLESYSSSGFGFDIGMYSMLNEYVSFGASFQDIVAPKVTLNKTEYKYPFKARFGMAAYPLPELIIGADMSLSVDKNALFSIGAEYSLFKKIVMLRAGFNSLNNSISFGAGVDYKGIGLDYSFNTHSDLGNISKFGLVVKFDLLKKK